MIFCDHNFSHKHQMTEDYRNRLVRDVQGIVEGDRPLYRQMAESIADYVVKLFEYPEMLNRGATINVIERAIEKTLGFDLTGYEHEFDREDEGSVRNYYENLASQLASQIRVYLRPIILNHEDWTTSDTIDDIISDYIYNTLAKRGYLRTPYEGFEYTYILPNETLETINVNTKMTVKDLYDEFQKLLHKNNIRIYSGGNYLFRGFGSNKVVDDADSQDP